MSDLAGRTVVVLGAGRSGVAAARLAKARGAGAVVVVDNAPAEKLARLAGELAAQGIELRAGFGEDAWAWDASALVLVSPGVAAGSALARRAASSGAELLGEQEFASLLAPWPLLAVTGTNGKTTTTELLTACLNAAGRRAVACGNIGTPLSAVVLENPPLDYAVVEVSSFQMEFASRFHPLGGIVLNVTPDHLNRHGSMEAYRRLKLDVLRQLRPNGHAVYHAALEPWVETLAGCSRSRLWLSGEALPPCPGPADWAVSVEGIGRAGEPPLVPRASLCLKGNHNLANAMAVAALLTALGIPLASYRQALESFQAGAHRIERVVQANGVDYVDDSKATDVDAMRQALCTIGPVRGRKIHLIAGGLDKGCDLTGAETELRMYVKGAYLIGACRSRLAQTWGGEIPCREFGSLEEAVEAASAAAEPGDVVLLSPACASMDMFRDYAERGDRFAAAARRLASK